MWPRAARVKRARVGLSRPCVRHGDGAPPERRCGHLRGDGGAEVDAPVITPRLIGALGGALGHLARAWPAATTRLAWSASPTSSPLWVSLHPNPTLLLSAPVWAARQREWARQRRSARLQAQAAPPAESAHATCQTHEATTPKAGDLAASSACNDNERGTP